MKLRLVQPKLRRAWELRRGDEVVATLRIPLFRRGAEIEIGDSDARIEPSGLVRTSVAVRDTATGEERMRIGRENLRRVLELGGRRTEWRSLGWGSTYGFVDADGEHACSRQGLTGAHAHERRDRGCGLLAGGRGAPRGRADGLPADPQGRGQRRRRGPDGRGDRQQRLVDIPGFELDRDRVRARDGDGRRWVTRGRPRCSNVVTGGSAWHRFHGARRCGDATAPRVRRSGRLRRRRSRSPRPRGRGACPA